MFFFEREKFLDSKKAYKVGSSFRLLPGQCSTKELNWRTTKAATMRTSSLSLPRAGVKRENVALTAWVKIPKSIASQRPASSFVSFAVTF